MYAMEAAVQFIVQKRMVVYKIKAVKGEPTAKANDELMGPVFTEICIPIDR